MVTEIVKLPIISYHSGFDATINFEWVNKLTDINIITTKVITQDFIDICVKNKSKIFIHYVCNGTGGTILEPNIPDIKFQYYSLKALFDAGFPTNQLLVIVKPIIPNDNGIKSIELLMKLFSKFQMLRLRYVRFERLSYYKNKQSNTYEIASKHINKHINRNPNKEIIRNLLVNQNHQFFHKYNNLIHTYNNGIITIDNETEPIIGTRELRQFGYINNNYQIIKYKIINKKRVPIVKRLNTERRCQNVCVLCPFR